MNLPGLDFQLGEDIDALRDSVRDFAQAEIAQHEARCRQLLAAPARRKPARAAS